MKIDWVLIKKIIEDNASPQEQCEFDAWFNDSDANRSYFKEIKNYYESPISKESLNSQSKRREVDGKSIITNYHRRKIRRILLSATSSAAALLVLSFFVFNHYTPKVENGNIAINDYDRERITVPTLITPDSVIEIVVDNSKIIAADYSQKKNKQSPESKKSLSRLIIPSGRTYTILLPDSTEVMLNANSELSYPSDFNDMSNREVILKGEAFFNVKKSSKPFMVKTSNGACVKVYGTQFNIDAKDSNEVITILVEGSIGFISKGSEIKMKPNQMIVWNSINNSNELLSVNPDDYLGWKRGLFEYVNGNFNHIVKELSSWYGVKFNYEEVLFETYNLSISIDRDEKIDDLLTIIESITNTENIKFIKNKNGEYSIVK